MKDEAIALARNEADPVQRRNLLREYLQAFTMRSLHESEAFLSIAFVGGTALRFLYNLPRFSEDLDFSLVDQAGYNPEKWMRKLERDLALAGFKSTIRWKAKNTVHTGWVKAAGILHAVGLAGRPEENLSIKVEIDTKPPDGAVTMTEVVTRRMTFAVRVHDLPSLMAGKVHALICRAYCKGRDWYDLLWYRSHRPPAEPNPVLLQNALDQTEGQDRYAAEQWPAYVLARLGQYDIAVIKEDVEPFLERSADAALLTREHLQTLLQGLGTQ